MKNRYDVAKFLHQPACGSQYRLWRLQVIDSVSQRSVSSRLIVCKKKRKKKKIVFAIHGSRMNSSEFRAAFLFVCHFVHARMQKMVTSPPLKHLLATLLQLHGGLVHLRFTSSLPSVLRYCPVANQCPVAHCCGCPVADPDHAFN